MEILACVPVDTSGYNLPPYVIKPGYKVANCEKCNMEVWIGPRQQEKKKNEPCVVWCMICCIKEYPEAEVKNMGGD